MYVDVEDTYDINIDADSFTFDVSHIDEKPQKPKKKHKLSKTKLLRAAQKKQGKEFLSRILANGEITSAEAHRLASNEGIQVEALHRAKGSLGIHAIVTESGSVWRLPQKGKQKGTDMVTTDGG